MPRKRTYRQFKDKGYRFPFIARILNSAFIYVVFFLASILALTMMTFEGVSSFQRMHEVKEEVSPFMDIASKPPPSADWAKSFVELEPPNVTGWVASSSIAPAQPFTFKECTSFGLLPKDQYMALSANGDNGTSILVQLYAAGTAAQQFIDYRSAFNNCFKVKDVTIGDPQINAYLFDGGFSFTYGDAIVIFRTPDRETAELLLPWYVSKAAATLTESLCYDLVVTENDVTRNLYVDPEKYTGLLLTDNVTTTIETGNIPTQIFPTVFNKPKKEQPEGPLPDTLPLVAENPLEKPTVPEPIAAPADTYTKGISYEERDENGPGCGWAWNGQEEPNRDHEKIMKDKTTAYQNAQLEVDGNAQSFVENSLNQVRSGIRTRELIERWNLYVNDVERVHERWDWFNGERDKLYRPWRDFVKEHDEWVNFDNRKANAQKTYDQAVAVCVAQDKLIEEWEEEWGDVRQPTTPPADPPYTVQPEPTTKETTVVVTPPSTTVRVTVTPSPTGTASPVPTVEETIVLGTPTNSPTTVVVTPEPYVVTPTPTAPPSIYIAPRPSECEQPVPASILSVNKSAEPASPAIPEGVTIPNSWVKPITTPTVKLR